MRFLRLDYRDDLRGLDLHPLISVVSVTDPDEREHLLEAIRRISIGSTAGLRGLVEREGLLLELDATVGEPLHDIASSATVVTHIDGIDRSDVGSGLHRELERWRGQAAIDSATVEEIRSHLDLSVKARAHQLRSRLEPRPVPQAQGPGFGNPRVRAVRLAFDAVNAAEPMIPQSAPEVEQLILRWERFEQRRSGHDQHLAGLAAKVAEAEQVVTEAVVAVTQAEEQAKPVLLNAEDEARLDELYSLSNQTSLWRKGLNSDEAAEMMSLLNSVGVSSYTEYGVQRMSPVAAPDKLAAVAEAEMALDRARQLLDQARLERAEDDIAVGLRDELRAIKAECRPFLGVLVPSDIGGALRQLLQLVENPEWVEAVNQLRDVLSSNDLHPPGGFETTEILGWTDSWLRAQESMPPPTGAPQPGPDPTGRTAGIEAANDLEHELQILIRHEQALAQIDRAEGRAARSALRVQRLEDQFRERSAAPSPATAAEVMAIVDPVAEQVLDDLGESVPVAIVGELTELPAPEVEALMEALEDVAQRVQIVVVTGNQAVMDWADRVGLARADLRRSLTAIL